MRAIRRHAFELALLAVMAGALFAPAVWRGEVFTVRDHLDYFQPLRWFTAHELREGRLPLWNPYSAAGEPWLANPQTGVFYPPAWLFLVLPFPAAYMAYLLVHLLLLGGGAYLFFSRGVAKEAALVGAAALMFGGPALSMMDISNNLATFAWIPLVLLAAKEKKGIAGGAALALAFMAGEPFFAAVAAVLFVVVARSWRTVAVAAAVAVGLSAVQLFPFLDVLIGSDRAAGLDPKQVLRDSMPIAQWIRLAVPPPLGKLDATLTQHFIPVVYSGVLVVALALAGLVVALRSQRALLGWVVLIGVAAAIGAGPDVLTRLPLTLFRYPARTLALGSLAITALAAVGWNSLRPGKRWIDLLLVLAIAGDLLAHAQPLLRTGAFNTSVPYPRSIGGDSLFLRVGPFAGKRRSWMSGYLNLYDRRYDAYTAAPFASQDYQRFYQGLMAGRSRFLLDAGGIGHVLTSRALPKPFVLEAESAGVRAYAYREGSTIATVWQRADVAPSRGQALETLLAGASTWPVAGLGTPLAGRAGRRSAASASCTTSSAVVTVETDAPALVVLAQRDARGWSVKVDGKPAQKLEAGGLFRAVRVGSGRHTIVWTYAPVSFFVGLLLTLITLPGVVFRVFVKRRSAADFDRCARERE